MSREQLEADLRTKRPQAELVDGVSYIHTFDPMGHVCPMHYRCTMTIRSLPPKES